MEHKIIVLPAAEAPGLVWRARAGGERVPYWVAPKKAVGTGFTPKTVRLTPTANSAELAIACRKLQAEALEWISGVRGSVVPEFDGSIGSLIRMYQTDELSGFHECRASTRETYTKHFRMLDRLVGNRAVHSLSCRDFKRWYEDFRKPAEPGGRERISRAHDMMNMLRMLFKFGIRVRAKGCKELSEELSTMSFQNSQPRSEQLTLEQVELFCAEALRSGRLSLALATCFQFETALRQKDVIGEYVKDEDGRGWQWGLVWEEHISDDLIMVKPTSKSNGAVKIANDLKLCPLIMEHLKYIPAVRRSGPVIVSETTGLPYAGDTFRQYWRAVAKRAGVPDVVRNMDARAGAVTEADEAKVSLDHMRNQTGHKGAMVYRYARFTQRKNDEMMLARVAARQARKEQAS